MWKAFEERRFTTNVAALTYTTVLSVVPVLALTLAMGRGFGLEGYIEAQLRANLNVQEGVIEQLMTFANSYISRTQDSMIVGVSLLVLLFTLISLVNNIEEKFNAMWGIRTSRPLLSFSLSYLGLIVFLIFALVFMSGLWIAVLQLLEYLPSYDLVQRTIPFFIFLGKCLTSSGLFMLMYKFVPVTRVQWRHTFLPGFLAGTLFTLLQQFYIQSQLFLSSYNAVYGSFALLPLLMMWLYLTWFIGLGGVLFSHVLQCAEHLDQEDEPHLSHSSRDLAALMLLQKIVHRFLKQEPTLPTSQFAEQVQLSLQLTEHALQRLERIGVLCHIEEEDDSFYKLDTDIYQLHVSEVLRLLDEEGRQLDLRHSTDEIQQLVQLRKDFLSLPKDKPLKDL